MSAPLISGHCAVLAAIAMVLGFLTVALLAFVIAVYQRLRLGSRLLAECAGDYATAWAELATIRRANLAADKLIRRGIECMRKRGAS